MRGGILRCPACNADIIPNASKYTAADFLNSCSSEDEETPLLRPTLFQQVYLVKLTSFPECLSNLCILILVNIPNVFVSKIAESYSGPFTLPPCSL